MSVYLVQGRYQPKFWPGVLGEGKGWDWENTLSRGYTLPHGPGEWRHILASPDIPGARGDLAWAVRARTNTLATPDNMARWGKRVDTQCQISNCGAPSNLGHVRCKRSLDRFQFRHDSVLSHIVQKILSTKQGTVTVYAEFDGWCLNDDTLPPDLTLNPQKPNILLLDQAKKLVNLLELTCPFDCSSGFKAAYDRKTFRYEHMALDCRGLGYKTYNMPLEVGLRRVINARNHTVLVTLAWICKICKIRGLKTFRRKLWKISLVDSYRIYLARGSSEWTSEP